ncbi:hypothetical protein P3631_24200, partial [Vibrio parahaemolyticus]
ALYFRGFMKHFYFKYLKENTGIDRLIAFYHKKSVGELIGETFPVSIYFGQWQAGELNVGLEQNSRSQSSDQIKQFYALCEAPYDCFLWVFYKSYILQLKVVGNHVYDGFVDFVDDYGSFPKSIDVELVRLHNKIELPEVFSNINSNQGYNRKTITELKGVEKLIADALCDNKKIKIDSFNFLNFLSPTEFETLAFMIFSNDRVVCSSYRGGTLKDYDLRIKVFDEFHGISVGTHWVQVKFKNNYKSKDGLLTITMNSVTNLDRNIIGRDWLEARVNDSVVIRKWLNQMVFDYLVFQVKEI